MDLHQQVATLMRGVAADAVMPRFRTLAAHEVADKGAGEIVTRADHEAEAALREGLARIDIGARIVGEEACSADAALLENIGDGLVWLVDPLDGTANFAAGRAPFGMMIAFVDDGVPIASWILDPLTGRLCAAVRGKGATIDGVPVHVRPGGARTGIATLGTQFMPTMQRLAVHDAAERHFQLRSIPRCAAESYARLVIGQNDAALFQRILPWDHAAGALFLIEAGGVATHWDGAPYRVGSPSPGILLANSRKAHQAMRDALSPLLLADHVAPELVTA